jgi:hypothetical protein
MGREGAIVPLYLHAEREAHTPLWQYFPRLPG